VKQISTAIVMLENYGCKLRSWLENVVYYKPLMVLFYPPSGMLCQDTVLNMQNGSGKR